MEPILSFVIALALTMASLPLLMRFSSALGHVDEPFGRHGHDAPMPRVGGISIVFAVLTAVALVATVDGQLLTVIGGMAAIALLGWLDDQYDLRARYELAVQLLVTGAVVLALGVPGQLAAIGWVPLLVVIGVLFVVGVTNAVNMVDGLDGLAAGTLMLSIMMATVVAYELGQSQVLILTLALLGGLVGFLRFNNHPAEVFLGDAGSQFLGFGGAILVLVLLTADPQGISPAAALLLFGLPIVDCLTVILRRLYRGVSIFQGDRFHLHHRLIDLGLRDELVVALLYGLHALALAVAYVLRWESGLVLCLAFLAYWGGVIGLVRMLERRGGAADRRSPPQRRNALRRRFSWLHGHGHWAVFAAVLGLIVFAFVQIGLSQTGSYTALAIALTAAVIWWWQRSGIWAARAVAFGCSAVLAFEWLVEGSGIWSGWLDVGLAGLALVLFASVLVTRKVTFRFDAQDWLVLLLLSLLFLVPVSFDSVALVVRVATFVVFVHYAVEFVLARSPRSAQAISGTGVLLLLGTTAGLVIGGVQ